MKPHSEVARPACRAELRPNSLLHIVAGALLGTAALMLLTGTDMGPFAPLIISEGIYLAALSLLLELGLLGWHGWQGFLAWRVRGRTAPAPEAQQ